MIKKIFIYIIFGVYGLNVTAQDIVERQYAFTDYPCHVKTIKYEVLDINFSNNKIAFKHVHELLSQYDETGELYNSACDCKYSGMQKYPKAGVILGTYDLANQKYDKVFTIYKSAYKKKDCFDYETSKIFLKGAKATFKVSNLNIENKPKAYLFSKSNSKLLDFNGLKFTYTSDNITENDKMLTLAKLFVNGKLLLTVKQEDNFAMASGGEIKFISAYVKDDMIIFLYKFHHVTSMAGETDFETYNFTRVFSISYLKDK